MSNHFSGSYVLSDVTILLKQLSTKPLSSILEKERLIQSGEKHYSEVIGEERTPSKLYSDLFEDALHRNVDRMAYHIWCLAHRIFNDRGDQVVLVSLARAGIPIGVLLRRCLRDIFGIDAPHYSVSIIRDRGLDREAIRFITARHDASKIIFVDGWTGKGAIANELRHEVSNLKKEVPSLSFCLYVLADLAGVASTCATNDDYLIPSAIMNATISGLISRTILNEEVCAGDFHGCLFYTHLRRTDRSREFVDFVHNRGLALAESHGRRGPEPTCHTAAATRCRDVMERLTNQYSVEDRNYIKPGIGEATRALMRRTPRLLVVTRLTDPNTLHLEHLAREQNVPIQVDPFLKVNAAVIIKRLSHA